ncbi:MAG TPA: MarR family winged helix-turn-helix transcriptional regulator [Erysipelotrichaceae bacterium]|nr:MarR family winged helix-turn-helix transcriptional regulator [Erysipelotrichaceae bacterium]
MTKSDTQIKYNIGRLISILHRQAQIFHTQQLKDINISSSEFPFLLYLNSKDGVTQETLVNFYGMDKAAVTRSIQSLEEKELVYREKSKDDLRCNHIYLTDKGRQLMPELRQRVDRWSDYLREDLNSDEVEQVINVLVKMVEKVERNRNGEFK